MEQEMVWLCCASLQRAVMDGSSGEIKPNDGLVPELWVLRWELHNKFQVSWGEYNRSQQSSQWCFSPEPLNSSHGLLWCLIRHFIFSSNNIVHLVPGSRIVKSVYRNCSTVSAECLWKPQLQWGVLFHRKSLNLIFDTKKNCEYKGL